MLMALLPILLPSLATCIASKVKAAERFMFYGKMSRPMSVDWLREMKQSNPIKKNRFKICGMLTDRQKAEEGGFRG